MQKELGKECEAGVGAVVAAAADGKKKISRDYNVSGTKTYPLWINPCHDGVALISFANGVMIHAEFLGDQMNDPPLLRSKSTRKGKFVTHPIVLEKQDPGIDFQG